MNPGYLREFSHYRIKEALLNPNNISILEDILNKDIQNIKRLQKKKVDVSIDRRKDLTEILKEVKPEVDDFLSVYDVVTPTIDYSSNLAFLFIKTLIFGRDETSYDPTKRHITVGFYGKNEIISEIAHEYTHHIQKEKGFPFDCRYKFMECFMEGQARSIERHISLKRYAQEENPALLLAQLKYRQIPEIQDVYLWLTKNLGIAQNSSLLQGHRENKYIELDTHALGNAFFSILEAREGTGIHKEIMAGRYQLPSF